MNRIAASLLASSAILAAAPLLYPVSSQAESLQAKVQQEQRMHLPTRGMTMNQVRREYGAPLKVLPTRGGGSKAQPPIHRWEYGKYIVYFEYSHVVHSVLRTPGADAL